MNARRRIFLLTILTAVALFSASDIYAGCNDELKLQSASEVAARIYATLTSTFMVDGQVTPHYFRLREKFPHYAFGQMKEYDAEFDAMSQYAYDKLNDPQTLRVFIIHLLKQAYLVEYNVKIALNRDKIKSQLITNLTSAGFIVRSARMLSSKEFEHFMSEGVVIEESSEQVLSAHGHDSHLLQLAYLLPSFESRFGRGSLLKFYKKMGLNGRVWSVIFDSGDTDHLGNPALLNRLVSTPLGLK